MADAPEQNSSASGPNSGHATLRTFFVPGSPAVWLAQLLLAIAIILLIRQAGPVVTRQVAAHAYPYQMDETEGYVLARAAALAHGESIYHPIDQLPYTVANYTPLFEWVYSKLNGPKVTLESLPLGRLLMAVSTWFCAAMLAFLAAWRTRRLAPALLAPLLFLASFEVHQWTAFVRVDLPALALTLAGLAVFTAVPRRWGLIGSALIFVAAAYTRQTALLAPAACAISLALTDRRRLGWFLAPYIGAGLLVFAWLQWRTGGEFYRHVVVYNRNVMDWAGLRGVLRFEIWYFYRWWIVAALALIAFRRLSPRRSKSPVTSLYGALAVASLVSYAKAGAAPNYVLEPLAAGALWTAEAVGLALDSIEQRARAGAGGLRTRYFAPAAAWVALGLIVAHAAYIQFRPQLHWNPNPTRLDRAKGDELLALVRSMPGDVISEEPVFTLLAGKPVLFQPYIMSQLAREGRWDDQRFADLLTAHQVDCLILTEDISQGSPGSNYFRYTAAMGEAIRRTYRPGPVFQLHGLRKTYYVWLEHAPAAR